MFTGIIEAAGKIEALELAEDGGRLRVNIAEAWPDSAENGSGSAGGARESGHPPALKISDSIAVNGCCLTVVEVDAHHFAADLSGETLRRTAIGEKKPGAPVNLERPLAAGARLGGHFVQGHVDGVGRVTRLVREGDNWWLSVRIPEELRRYVAEKGSIAIDGISLTVARWHDGVADFAIIPFTYQHTNIHSLTVGDAVNVENDILAKYVESLLDGRSATSPSRLTIAELTGQGF
jgi:riboflavin synthase